MKNKTSLVLHTRKRVLVCTFFGYLKKGLIVLFWITIYYPKFLFAQESYEQAIAFEAQHEDLEALRCFEKVLEGNPGHIAALCHASKLHAHVGGRKETKNRKEHLLKAKFLALSAIHVDRGNADAHFHYIVSLGLLSEMADNAIDKLENARLIKGECEIVLQLNPNYAPAYYVLGRWHDALSSLNLVEKFFINAMLGGIPPDASFSNAIICFEKAISLQPGIILFHYGLAKALAAHSQNERAIETLRHAIMLPVLEPDDFTRIETCKFLLKHLQKTKTL